MAAGHQGRASGSAPLFERRLAWSGLDEGLAARRLAGDGGPLGVAAGSRARALWRLTAERDDSSAGLSDPPEARLLAASAWERSGARILRAVPALPQPWGLFRGAAGIAYEVLRIHYPDVVPAILLWRSAQRIGWFYGEVLWVRSPTGQRPVGAGALGRQHKEQHQG